MSYTVNTKAYALDTIGTSSATYIGPGKTVSVKDDLKMSRQAAKSTATYSGNARAKMQLTRTSTLVNAKTLTGDVLGVVEVSAPVGTQESDIDTLLADIGSFVASADFKALVKRGLFLKP